MSYNRWSNGNWYVWYDTSSGKTQDEQVVSVWHMEDCNNNIEATKFNYKELVKSPDIIAKKLDKKYHKDEYDELNGYINSFKEDVKSRKWM